MAKAPRRDVVFRGPVEPSLTTDVALPIVPPAGVTVTETDHYQRCESCGGRSRECKHCDGRGLVLMARTVVTVTKRP